jgi:hypothetical protein
VITGKQAILTLSSGLKLAVFGGSFSLEHYTSSALPSDSLYFTPSALSAFSNSASLANVDILLLNTWPSQIMRYSDKVLSETISKSSIEEKAIPALQGLLNKARPKYAFVGNENIFWEREPFVYPSMVNADGETQQQQQRATRFLSLGQFGNPTKQRWFYAFSIAPSAKEQSQEIPSNVTPYPFDTSSASGSGSSANGARGIKRTYPNDSNGYGDENGGSYIFANGGQGGEARKKRHGEPPQSYKCKICGVPGHFIQVRILSLFILIE